eukprot:13378804-Alexandrium_andersonii.AAC.1
MAPQGCIGMTASGAWAKPHRERRSSTHAQCNEEANGRTRIKRALPKCNATGWMKNNMPRAKRRGGQWP